MIHVYHVNIQKLFIIIQHTVNIWIILNISEPYRLLFEPPQKPSNTEKTKLESPLAQPGRCKMCFCQVVRSLVKKWSRDESILSSLMVFNNKAVGVRNLALWQKQNGHTFQSWLQHCNLMIWKSEFPSNHFKIPVTTTPQIGVTTQSLIPPISHLWCGCIRQRTRFSRMWPIKCLFRCGLPWRSQQKTCRDINSDVSLKYKA